MENVKNGWKRIPPFIEITSDQFVTWFPQFSQMPVDLKLIEQGLSNTHYLVHADKDYILRCMRDNTKYQIELQIIAMLDHYIPVPSIVDQEDQSEYHLYLMDVIAGQPMVTIQLNKDRKSHLFHVAGRILSNIHSFTFDQAGFFDDSLNIATPLEISEDSIVEVFDSVMNDAVCRKLEILVTPIQSVVRELAFILDSIDNEVVLVHGDYNPPNIMVDGFDITGIMDWEFAFANSRYFDIGNFLRLEEDLNANHVQRFVSTYEQYWGHHLPENWKLIIRLFDLLSLLTMIERSPDDSSRLHDLTQLIMRYLQEMLDFLHNSS